VESIYYHIWQKLLYIFGYAIYGWKACCPSTLFFFLSTIRTDRMNSVHNTNMPHQLSIWHCVNDTSLFPTQRQSFPTASAFLPTFKIKWLRTLRKALHRSAVIQFNFLLRPLRQEIRIEERRGCGKKRRTREGQN